MPYHTTKLTDACQMQISQQCCTKLVNKRMFSVIRKYVSSIKNTIVNLIIYAATNLWKIFLLLCRVCIAHLPKEKLLSVCNNLLRNVAKRINHEQNS